MKFRTTLFIAVVLATSAGAYAAEEAKKPTYEQLEQANVQLQNRLMIVTQQRDNLSKQVNDMIVEVNMPKPEAKK